MRVEDNKFKGLWIPYEILHDKNLTPTDKLILVEINYLDNKSHCYASNEYIASVCNCSISQVTNSIKKLIKLGYIQRLSTNPRERILISNLNY